MSTTDAPNTENENSVTEPTENQAIVTTSTEIKLTFINESNDANNSQIVIFQKNVAQDFADSAVAWRVIKNCARGWEHPFVYSMDIDIAASDSYGNQSPLLRAHDGQKWQMVTTASGDQIILSGQPAASPVEIELQNSLQQGSINAEIYRDGKLLGIKSGLAPMQKAVFQFRPTIYIGVVSQVEEGGVLSSAILSDINTEISLLGIEKADIIMTGGGVGPSAKPFEFHLVVK